MVFFRILGAFLALGSCFVSEGHAATVKPALVVVVDGHTAGTADTLSEVFDRIAVSMARANLYDKYRKIDFLVEDRASADSLFYLLRARGTEGPVDLFVLNHGSRDVLLFRRGDLSDTLLRAQGRFPNLRMVYMLACHSSTMIDAWTQVGARLVIAHKEVNSMPQFFLPRFIENWASGKDALTAVKEAYWFSESNSVNLAQYIDNPGLLNSMGVGKSEPVLEGMNLDALGRYYPTSSMQVVGRGVRLPANTSLRRYVHTQFESFVFGLLNTVIPQTALDMSRVPGIQASFNIVKELLWSLLGSLFSVSTNDRIWMDGDSVRLILAPVLEWIPARFQPLIMNLVGVNLVRVGNELQVAVYLTRDIQTSLKDHYSTRFGELYQFTIPKNFLLNLSMNDGVVRVRNPGDHANAVRFRVALPVLPDGIYLRNFALDLSTGDLEVEAGVVGDTLAVVANAQLIARKFRGIDLWETIERNLQAVDWPTLYFRVR